VQDDPGSDAELAADEAQLAAYASELADAVDAALPGFVERCVRSRAPDAPDEAVSAAGQQARSRAGRAVRALLALDIDDQWTNPLALLRGAIAEPTRVLADLGIPPVPRDADAQRLFPDDAYDLTPGSFADVDPALHEPGLRWGAAKAYVHLTRRRRLGD
jgi:hypothetical protein